MWASKAEAIHAGDLYYQGGAIVLHAENMGVVLPDKLRTCHF